MRTSTAAIWLTLLVGCAGTSPPALTPADGAAIERDVRQLLDAIARDLAREGPVGWLPHFVSGDEFFMASDGKLAFANFTDAKTLCEQMAAQFDTISMHWSDVRVQPLAPGLATFAASYSENLHQKDGGGERHYEGYVTAVAVRSADGWRLQSLHWSSAVPDQALP